MSADAERDVAFSGAHVRSGSIWMLSGQVGGNLLRFVSNLVLTHLLLRSCFGQQALIISFVQLLELLTDVGVWIAVVQSPRGAEPRFLNTVWTVQVLRGICLFVVACLVAPVYASYYGDPGLAPLIYVSAVSLLLGGVGSARMLLLRRRMAARPLVLTDLGAQVVGAAASVGIASIWPSTMALVLGGLAAATLRLIVSYMLPGPRDRFAWDSDALRQILRIGIWTFINTLLSFLAMQDRLVFGKLVSQEDLGVYYIAWMIASVPAGIVAGMSWTLLLPLVSSHVRSGVGFAAKVLRARRPLLLLGGWSLSGLCAGGPLITDFIYPDGYTGAGFLLQCVAVSLWLGVVLEQTRAAILISISRLVWTCAGSLTKLAGIFVLVPLCYARWGFDGAVVGYVCAELPRLVTTWWLSRRSGVSGFRQDVGLSGVFAVGAFLGNSTRLALAGWHEVASMLAVFVVVTLCWLPFGGREALAFLRRR